MKKKKIKIKIMNEFLKYLLVINESKILYIYKIDYP